MNNSKKIIWLVYILFETLRAVFFLVCGLLGNTTACYIFTEIKKHLLPSRCAMNSHRLQE